MANFRNAEKDSKQQVHRTLLYLAAGFPARHRLFCNPEQVCELFLVQPQTLAIFTNFHGREQPDRFAKCTCDSHIRTVRQSPRVTLLAFIDWEVWNLYGIGSTIVLPFRDVFNRVPRLPRVCRKYDISK